MPLSLTVDDGGRAGHQVLPFRRLRAEHMSHGTGQCLRLATLIPGGPMACSASREAEAGRVSASRAGGHAPRTGERVARKSLELSVCVV